MINTKDLYESLLSLLGITSATSTTCAFCENVLGMTPVTFISGGQERRPRLSRSISAIPMVT